MHTTTSQPADTSSPLPATASTQSLPSAAPANDVQQPWIHSPLWDACWIFSGMWAPAASVLAYAWSGGLELGVQNAPAFHQQHFVLLLTSLGVLHRLSSIHAVVLSPILAREVRAHPRRYVYVPLAILIWTLLLAQAFTFHASFAFLGSPGAELWAFYALAFAVLLWDRWHFSMQEFGVLSLYRARAGQTAPHQRRFDRIYVVLLMLCFNSVLYVRAGFDDDVQVLWGGAGVEAWIGQSSLERSADVVFGAVWVLMAVAVLRELRQPRRSWPKLLYYLVIGSHSLILYAVPTAMSLFFLSYVFHHWMVAIGLFNRLTLNSYHADSRWTRAGRYLVRVGPWLAACVLASLFLAPLDLTAQLTPLPTREAFRGASVAARIGAGLAIGAFFGFSFLHYYYDRCLYSFSIEGVRRAVGPLLFADRARRRVRQ